MRARNSLTFRILLTVVIFCVLLMAAAVSFMLYQRYNDDLETLNYRLQQVSEAALSNIALSAWNYDDAQLQLQLESIFNIDDVVFVEARLEDFDGEIRRFSVGSRAIAGDELVKIYPIDYEHRGKSKQLGSLEVIGTDRYIMEELRASIWQTILTVVSTLTLFAVAMIFFLQRALMRHIRDIAAYMRGLNIDNLGSPLALQRMRSRKPIGDELDDVVNAVNEMRRSLIEEIDMRHTLERDSAQEKVRSIVAEQQVKIERANAEDKANFLAAMSHEIRTPVNGILGMSDLLSDEEMTATQRQYVSTVATCSRTLLNVINDILDFSKLEAGKLEICVIDTNLCNLLAQTSAAFRAQIDKKGLDLYLSLEPGCPWYVRADELRIQQVLNNLISNAVKFTHEGHVSVSVGFDEQNQGFRFAVSDTGIGIDEEGQAKLFQGYSQTDKSISRKYGGTGLGLSISKNLVELMGGHIQCDSEAGRGSCFHFTLFPEINQELENKKNGMFAGLKEVTVALIGTDSPNRATLSRLFERWCAGVEIYDVDSGILERLEGRDKLVPFLVCDQSDQPCRDLAMTIKSTAIVVNNGFNSTQKKQLEDNDKIHLLAVPSLDEEALTLLNRVALGDERTVTTSAAEKAIQDTNIDGSILVAEDNPVNRKVISIMLQKIGCTVDFAVNGQEAVDIYTKTPDAFDLVLMDFEMPLMDGCAATEAIRKWEGEDRHIPIIALTAHALDEFKNRCMNSGMDDLLVKPVVRQDLYRVLEHYITSTVDH